MNKKVLIIDDEQGIRDLLTFLLKPKGFDITCAEDGLEGIEKFKKESFDIVLLDIHMPKMNGLEVLKVIKKIKPEQIVIIFSSSSDPQFELEKKAELSFGVKTCLYKPFNIDEIITVINDVLKI
ncbi:MAG: response regulator [Endomicrobiia bacterium]